MEKNHTDELLKYSSLNSPPVADAVLYTLATVKAELFHSHGKVTYQLTDDVFARLKDSLEKHKSQPYLFAAHFIRCFLEQPNKGKVLLQLLSDPRMPTCGESEITLREAVSTALGENIRTCDNSFLFQRSLSLASHLNQEWPLAIVQTLKSILQSPNCNFNRSKRVLVDLSSFEWLTGRDPQHSILKTVFRDETSRVVAVADGVENYLDVTFPVVGGNVQDDTSFGSTLMYLHKKKKSQQVPVEDISQIILEDISGDGSVDERASSPMLINEEVPFSPSPIVDITSPAQSMHFFLHTGLMQFLKGMCGENGVGLQEIEYLCAPVHLALRFNYMQHILWANRLDARSCALAVLHVNEDCFLPGNSSSPEATEVSSASRAALNVYCILEDYLMLPNSVLVSWEISGGPSSPPGKSRLLFTIELLTHLANCPDSLSGEVFTSTLLALWTDAFTRIHTLDIEILDRLRLMLVSFINAQSFLFPWKTWYNYATEAVDERMLAGRKLFLFELLRDLAELSYPHRMRDATPQCLHAFIPTLKPPNGTIVAANVFDSFIRNADAATIRGIYAQRKESFVEHSLPIQLLDSILKVSRVSPSYQKQLLRKFREVFLEYSQTIERESHEASTDGEVAGSNSLLDHVYFFWTNDHANRVQTVKNLIDVGIVDSSRLPLWLDSACVDGVFEQSWVRCLLIHAAHATLRKWHESGPSVGSSSGTDDGFLASKPGESTSVQAFFFRAFQVLQKKITSSSDIEADEIAAFLGRTSLANQPKAHWSRRNVLVLHSAIGLLRWLIRMYFTYQIPRVFPEHPYQIGEIVFPVGPSNDFLARLWRQSVLLFGSQKETDQRNALKSELQSAQTDKHDAYRRYCARKRARDGCE
ncbi:hypothetical protein XU18_1821 [Perkinsela sp. CCAP 1560/4]|nr:hypothetical protein XU18_1821 [Perkinsela sp. CCAP 1560/4]|eukprot:KNH07289.1 hypothetical protein XU18_1821 [Perkinsela sp. CCAP 1560/4]